MLAVTAILAAATLPQIATGLERASARAATHYVAAQLGLARTQAVTRGATVAVRFDITATGTSMTLVLDGNGNGVRTQDMDAGIDREIQPAVALEEVFPGVAFGLPSETDGSGIRLGATNLLSFTPRGTSSSGSLYLLGRDGSHFAIRVLGATGRVRAQRFDPATGTWIDVL